MWYRTRVTHVVSCMTHTECISKCTHQCRRSSCCYNMQRQQGTLHRECMCSWPLCAPCIKVICVRWGTCLKALSLCIKLDFLVLVLFSLVVLVGLPEVPLPIVPAWGLPIFQKYLKISTCLATCMINQSINQSCHAAAAFLTKIFRLEVCCG